LDKITPLFLFSLPRAGSTLLQRMISAHPSVATSSEPWILLPAFNFFEHSGQTFSTYGHAMAIQAVHDFSRQMDGGIDDLKVEIKTMILRLYRRAATHEEPYFLDKTPRYHVISKDIVDMFPESKPIVLVRHPLAIVASMLETWADKKWYLYGYKFDLYNGVDGLSATCQSHPDKVLLVRYEDLLVKPKETMAKVFKHLGIESNEDVWSAFSEVEIVGHMKDPTGINNYKSLSSEPLEKWKSVFSNRYRVAWAHRYLNWLGEERLAMFGYNIDDIRSDLDALPKSWNGVVVDFLRSIYGWWRERRQSDVFEQQTTLLKQQRNILR